MHKEFVVMRTIAATWHHMERRQKCGKIKLISEKQSILHIELTNYKFAKYCLKLDICRISLDFLPKKFLTFKIWRNFCEDYSRSTNCHEWKRRWLAHYMYTTHLDTKTSMHQPGQQNRAISIIHDGINILFFHSQIIIYFLELFNVLRSEVPYPLISNCPWCRPHRGYIIASVINVSWRSASLIVSIFRKVVVFTFMSWCSCLCEQ